MQMSRTQDQSWNEANDTYSDLDGDIFSTSINLSSIDKPGQSKKFRHKKSHHHEKTPSYKFPKDNSTKHSKRMKDDSKNSDPKGKSGDMLIGGGFSENFEDEFICAIHHKDLDMICQEPECETPICSSCILFGEHKNHHYIEKVNFFKNVEMKRKGLVRLSTEVESAEIKLNKTNQVEEVFQKIRDKRAKMEKELEFNCAKAIRQIENRKIELEKTTKVYFENLEEKIHNYLKQTLDCIDLNQNWKRQCKELLRHLADESEEIENCFDFIKKMEKFNLSETGRRTLDAMAHVEEIIKGKIDESIRSFDFRIKTFDESFIQINKQEVEFNKDLNGIMQQLLEGVNPANLGGNPHEEFYDNNFEPEGISNEVPHRPSDYRESDLMNNTFDPAGSNLMLGINNQESQFVHESESYNDP
jgi:hypothetical protein